MAKNIFIGIGVVLVILIGLVIVAPSFIDSQALKAQITTQTRAATGRDLSIDGNLEVRVFPTPALTANGVRLSNAEGGEAAEMVSLKAVEVRIALLPLLSGQVQVERIRLVSPTISIEKLADGRTNLEFQPTATPSAPSKSTAPSPTAATDVAQEGGLDVRLDNFEITDGRVIYRDIAAGTVERVQDIDAQLRAVSLQGPFEAQGHARVRGVPLAYEVSLGQIIAERTVPLNAVVDAPGGARAQVTGAIFGLADTPRFKGKLKVDGNNLAQLLGAVSGNDAPGALAQDFSLESQVDASAEQVDVAELDLGLGQVRASGAVSVKLGDETVFDVNVHASRIDVDALLSAPAPAKSEAASSEGDAKQDVAVAPTPPAAQGAQKEAGGFAFPAGVRGTVQMSVDSMTLKGGLISDVRLTAELADGELALNQIQAIAPGVTELGVFGFVRAQNGTPRFDGKVEVTTANVLGLSEWIGVQLPDGVAGRVKRISLKSDLAVDDKQAVVSGLKITADKSTLTGGITLALRKRPSFGADLRLDALNLDTYLNGGATPPPVAQATAAKSGAPAQSTATKDSGQMSGALDALEAWSALSALNDFDANMKVRVGQLTHQGRNVRDLLLDGTLYAGTLTLRSLKVGDYIGASSDVSGSFTGFGGIPEMSKVKLNAAAKDAGRIATAFGVQGLPRGLKAVKLAMNADGSLLKPRFSATLNALGGEFGGAGSLSVLPINFGYDGTVRAKHGDLVKLLNTLDAGYAPAGPLGALDMTAKLRTDGKTHTLNDLKASIGDTPISGTVVAKTGGAKPNVVANLVTGALVLDRFLPKAQKNAALQTPKPGMSRWGLGPVNDNIVPAAYEPVGEQLAAADKRWSREQFDLSALNMVNGEVTLKSDAIAFGDYKLTSADIHASLAGGVLNADRIKGKLFGGPVDGSAVVRADAKPTLKSTIKLDAMKVGEAVHAITGKNLASGDLALNLDFNAAGLSPAALVSSLAGTGSLNIGALDVEKGHNVQGNALAGVFSLLSAMSELPLVSQKQSSGLADLSLNFNVKDGVANVPNMVLNTAVGKDTGSGTVDIAGWSIDFVGKATLDPSLLTTLLSKGRAIGKQEIPFTLKGQLDRPTTAFALGNRVPGANNNTGTQQKLDPFKSLIEKALPGVKLPEQTQPKTQPAPSTTQQPDGTLAPPPPPPQSGSSSSSSDTQPKQVKPEDLLRGLLKGL